MHSRPVTKNLIPPDLVLPGPNISKYLDHPELMFQKYIEIYGPPWKKWSPLGTIISKYMDPLGTFISKYMDPLGTFILKYMGPPPSYPTQTVLPRYQLACAVLRTFKMIILQAQINAIKCTLYIPGWSTIKCSEKHVKNDHSNSNTHVKWRYYDYGNINANQTLVLNSSHNLHLPPLSLQQNFSFIHDDGWRSLPHRSCILLSQARWIRTSKFVTNS